MFDNNHIIIHEVRYANSQENSVLVLFSDESEPTTGVQEMEVEAKRTDSYFKSLVKKGYTKRKIKDETAAWKLAQVRQLNSIVNEKVNVFIKAERAKLDKEYKKIEETRKKLQEEIKTKRSDIEKEHKERVQSLEDHYTKLRLKEEKVHKELSEKEERILNESRQLTEKEKRIHKELSEKEKRVYKELSEKEKKVYLASRDLTDKQKRVSQELSEKEKRINENHQKSFKELDNAHKYLQEKQEKTLNALNAERDEKLAGVKKLEISLKEQNVEFQNNLTNIYEEKYISKTQSMIKDTFERNNDPDELFKFKLALFEIPELKKADKTFKSRLRKSKSIIECYAIVNEVYNKNEQPAG